MAFPLVFSFNDAAAAALPAHIRINADSIGFYADRMLLSAEGHVYVHLPGQIIEGDELRYNLSGDSLLVSGNVQIITHDEVFTATAYRLNLVDESGVLLKLTPLPTTLSIRDGDIANGVESPAPPDTFKTIDLGNALPYIASTHADITPRASVRFTPAKFPVNEKLTVPSPSYLYVFAPNPSLSVIPPTLPSSSFDQPYGFIGTPNSLLAAHVRYNTAGGISTGIDEHLADGIRRYVVASFEPNDRHFDLDGFEQMSPHLTQNFIGSLARDEKTARYTLQRTSKIITATLTLSHVTNNILVMQITPTGTPATSIFNASSASDDLQVNTVTRSIGLIGSYKLRSDFGYDNDSWQLPYHADFRNTLGFSLYTRTIRGPLKTSLTGEYDFSSTHYDYPRQYAVSTALLTASKHVNRSLSFYGNVAFSQVAGRYGSQAFTDEQISTLLGRSPNNAFPIIAPDGTPYPGYSAYQGVQTQRTYFLSSIFTPNPNFNLVLSLTRISGFPQFHGIGPTPLTASFDLRVRPIRTLAVEFGRSYVFGWDNQHLTPLYTLGISP